MCLVKKWSDRRISDPLFRGDKNLPAVTIDLLKYRQHTNKRSYFPDFHKNELLNLLIAVDFWTHALMHAHRLVLDEIEY